MEKATTDSTGGSASGTAATGVTPQSTTGSVQSLLSLCPPPAKHDPSAKLAVQCSSANWPADAKTSRFYYYLGWTYADVEAPNANYIAEYATANNMGYLTADSPSAGLGHLHFLWRKILANEGFWFLEAIVPDASEASLSNEKPAEIIAIAGTHPSIRRRASVTQAQYDFLVKLYGKEARWYRDYCDKKEAKSYTSRFI
ncbi:hypothetical protein BV20DRAFT_971542 [Pilatotrama ljubarskyi]|nr:hypothetical protein BV20DRAFT_971542 [Pilatotrama ljubarskyi]